jgi:predicted phosphodiesterase
MRVAALYDIHANLPAAEAVLEDVARSGADLIVVGGDVVPGPMPREMLALLSSGSIPAQFIHGNGEVAVLAEINGRDSGVPAPVRKAIQWNAAQLERRDAKLMESWPLTFGLEISGIGRVLFCHATPQNPNDIFTRLTPEHKVAALFAGIEADLVVCGHTHMQFDRTVSGLRVANAGSVGMPFGEPRAHWLLLGPGVEFRRTDYDVQSAAARTRQTDYPDAEQFAATNILSPPSEEQMLQAMERS